MDLNYRLAVLDDHRQIEQLIAASARHFCRVDYTPEQIEGALGSAWAVDSQLIRDGTYFVAMSGSDIVGAGGWSDRGTLFGGDALEGRVAERLDPATEAARVRAFFVHPDWGRQGIGTVLLEKCERAAREAGFAKTELVATLTGVRLYERFGYEAVGVIDHPLPGGGTIRFIPMAKVLGLRIDYDDPDAHHGRQR